MDISTGLYYYGFRYLDGQTGRFTTLDPAPSQLGSPQSLNRYVYVLDNPMVNVDRDGRLSLYAEWVLLGVEFNGAAMRSGVAEINAAAAAAAEAEAAAIPEGNGKPKR